MTPHFKPSMTSRRRTGVLVALVLALAGCDGSETSLEESSQSAGQGSIDLQWTPLLDSEPGGALLSVWAGGPSDIWVVGGQEGVSTALHYDGSSWTTHDPGLGAQLWWVHGLSDGSVYMVGSGGGIARFRDGEFELMDTGLEGAILYGVWGAAADDMWACGGPDSLKQQAGEPTTADVLLHYDGSSWKPISPPYVSDGRSGESLFKVWGTDANNIFVVGSNGIALHYDGADWRTEDTGLAEGTTLFTVAGRTADDVYAVGGFGNPVLVHWDGSAWSQVLLPTSRPNIVQGLWTAEGHDVYIAGMDGFTSRLGADGVWSDGAAITSLIYHGIAGDRQGAIFAAGGDIITAKPEHLSVLSVAGEDVPAP